jgi:hypothetical protein
MRPAANGFNLQEVKQPALQLKRTVRMRNTRPPSTIEPLNLWQSEEIQMTYSANTTRRGFLSTAAVLAASAAVSIPANALGADPIFEAIEVHKAARLAFENAVSRGSALDQELPGEKTRS